MRANAFSYNGQAVYVDTTLGRELFPCLKAGKFEAWKATPVFMSGAVHALLSPAPSPTEARPVCPEFESFPAVVQWWTGVAAKIPASEGTTVRLWQEFLRAFTQSYRQMGGVTSQEMRLPSSAERTKYLTAQDAKMPQLAVAWMTRFTVYVTTARPEALLSPLTPAEFEAAKFHLCQSLVCYGCRVLGHAKYDAACKAKDKTKSGDKSSSGSKGPTRWTSSSTSRSSSSSSSWSARKRQR